MKEEILMPKMGESVMEGTLIKWHKNIGDKVKKDEIIFEISTDKVDTEVPSPVDGVLAEIRLKENETAPVGSVVAVIETETEDTIEGPKDKPVSAEPEKIEKTKPVGGNLIGVVMPKMGESVMEGTIIKWHKQVGDKVKKDEIIFEISTDKVDTEVPSPVDGVISEILYGENETVEVNKVVARISTEGEIAQSTGQEDTEKPTVTESPNIKEDDENAIHQTIEKSSVKQKGNRFYSPLVLNIARKEGISFDELDTIKGSGINGRVTKKDVLNYLKQRTAQPKQTTKVAQPEYTFAGKTEVIPMDNIRKKIMHHMILSRDTSVHVSEVMETDMTKIHNFIEQNKDRLWREENIKLTYMAFISYAAIKALKKYPLMNASIQGENIVMKKYVNLGIAVAVEPNGLIVPNIKDADNMNIRGLAKAIADLSYKARNKKLSPDDVVDGTFSITNYGVFGALFGTPIINQPEVGILGVGTVGKRPVVVSTEFGDTIAIKPMMYLTLSHDHRLVDGMLGGLFLKEVKEILENFDTSIV